MTLTESRLTRREFLKFASLTAGAGLLAGCGPEEISGEIAFYPYSDFINKHDLQAIVPQPSKEPNDRIKDALTYLDNYLRAMSDKQAKLGFDLNAIGVTELFPINIIYPQGILTVRDFVANLYQDLAAGRTQVMYNESLDRLASTDIKYHPIGRDSGWYRSDTIIRIGKPFLNETEHVEVNGAVYKQHTEVDLAMLLMYQYANALQMDKTIELAHSEQIGVAATKNKLLDMVNKQLSGSDLKLTPITDPAEITSLEYAQMNALVCAFIDSLVTNNSPEKPYVGHFPVTRLFDPYPGDENLKYGDIYTLFKTQLPGNNVFSPAWIQRTGKPLIDTNFTTVIE